MNVSYVYVCQDSPVLFDRYILKSCLFVEGKTCNSAGQCVGGGSTGNIVPTSCDEAHGLTGCCGPDNAVYWWEWGALQGEPENCGDNPCGWDAENGFYSCGVEGFIGEDPSGVFPIDCGLPNPVPADCAGD